METSDNPAPRGRSRMGILHGLNRRDKVTLFTTLTAVGLMLVYKTAIARALGVAVLGLALTWAVGHGCRLATLLVLNRRHKVLVLLTLMTAGLSLTLGLGLKFSLGIFILGLPLAWVVGSDRRSTHALLILLGTSVAGWSAILSWHEYKQGVSDYERFAALYAKSLQDFRSQLPRLAKLYPLESEVLSTPPFSIIDPLPVGLQVKAEAYRAFYDGADYYDFKTYFNETGIPEKAKAELYKAKAQPPLFFRNLPSPLPQWAAEALAAHVDAWEGPGRRAMKRLLTPELSVVRPYGQPPPLSAHLENHFRVLVSGLLSMVVGIVLVVWSTFGRDRPTRSKSAARVR